MPSYRSGDLITEIRARKRWTQYEVLHHNILSEGNLSRIENKHQNPSPNSFRKVMDSLQMPVETFFCPYLENQSVELIQIRETVLFYLTIAYEHPPAIEKSKDLITQMENTGYFNNGVNKQFLLSCKAMYNEIVDGKYSVTIDLINEGLAITFPEYDENTFESGILVFEETKLLHTKALAYMRTGDTNKAIELLERILSGLKGVPQDDCDKERIMAPVLLTLAQCFIQMGDYRKAFKICRKGYIVSIKRNKTFYIPDFTFYASYCLHNLNRADIAVSLIKQAYFGYTLLRRYDTADRLRKYACEELGFHIETYGVELFANNIPEPVFSYGKSVVCKSIGALIAAFRYEANLTFEELSKGICSVSNLSKIENGKIQGNVYHLEAIMQRLGRSIDKYFNTFLSHEDFTDKQTRDEINYRMSTHKYQEVEGLINELSSKKSYASGVNKQFIDLAKAELYLHKEGFNSEHLSLLKKVLNIDDKDFDYGIVARTRLTYCEIIAVNQIAVNYCSTGNISKGLRIFEDLKESMDRFIVDEVEKMRMYTGVLYNYSKYLGLAKRYEEAILITELGDDLCVKHGRLEPLPGLMLNHACGLLFLNRKEESLPYFAQAFYGFMLIDRLDDAITTKTIIFDNFGITLN